MHPRKRLWVLLTAAALALAGAAMPEVPMPTRIFRYLFVFDITQSMNVEDLRRDGSPQSRLAAAREAVATLLGDVPCGSEAGLAVFSGHRTFLLLNPVEICENYQELVEILQGVHWSMAWKARSEVSKGLDSALLTAKRMQADLKLVFLTDGHEAPPINERFPPKTKAEPGEVDGIVVGVGGFELAPIPRFDHAGQRLGYWQQNEVLQVDPYVLGRGGDVAGEGMVGVDEGDLAVRIANGTEHLSVLREAYLQERSVRMALQYHRLADPRAFSERLLRPDLGTHKSVPVSLGWLPALAALLMVAAMHLIALVPTGRGDRTIVNRP